ncbi:hypothetical protein [Tabrizicola sp.]|uniref:hypothetical protein n=1 Tax=Tabrizicola sp. TaxID=2005166 RepID=UPI0035269F0E
MHDLPNARRDFHHHRIGAAEQRQIGDTFQRAGRQIDDQGIAEIEARGRTGVEIRHQRANPGAAAKGGQQGKPIRPRAAEHRHLAWPWNRMGRDHGPMRGLGREVRRTLDALSDEVANGAPGPMVADPRRPMPGSDTGSPPAGRTRAAAGAV